MADHHRRGARYGEAIELAEVAAPRRARPGATTCGRGCSACRAWREAKGGDYERRPRLGPQPAWRWRSRKT